MPDPPPPSASKLPLAAMAALVAGYLGLNALCVFAPRIPDTTVFLLWALIFPLVSVLQTWLWFARSGRKCQEGLLAAILLTLTFVLAAATTFTVCRQIYQSI